ncbi:MAG: hypothetical protein ACRC7N_20755 [Clostridium sp.]
MNRNKDKLRLILAVVIYSITNTICMQIYRRIPIEDTLINNSFIKVMKSIFPVTTVILIIFICIIIFKKKY